ncbi:ThuA domain-containing protein, partial [Demequina sp. SO4-18]|uniref:ThuA domain-containing protein n=1 Tax=Demequina sp. SO4-18 TaxID=3401026 RepID=UPI003B59707C
MGAALAGTSLLVAAAPAQAEPVGTASQASLSEAPNILATDVTGEPEFSALLFTKTEGFRHGNIPTGISTIEQMGLDNGFTVDATEDATAFTEENLANYDVVIFFSTTGNVLNTDQEAAFETYIQNGGGFAGIHAASDTEYDWPWYEGLVGAYFQGHPPGTPNADVIVEDFAHPSTEHLPSVWNRTDEWYSFTSNPRADVHVLASLDNDSYTGGTMGDDHPIAWCHNYDGGRSWYTAGGHTSQSFSEPEFTTHVLEGIRTAAGVIQSDCNASDSDAYELVALDEDTRNPMSLNVTEDGTVFYLERNGELLRIDPDTQQVSTAMNLNVTNGNEDGLLGMALDPDFETNYHAFIYWSPATVSPEDGPHNRISRFTYDPSSGTFDPSSEVLVLKVETQRDECCHAGGDMVFDNDGNLILATGDNVNPFDSSGYTPIDERAGRSSWDAQGTSGNTNNLRGKIVRITPQPDGSYTVPDGNLFEEGVDLTRPEIYAMGFRNPFRIGLDPHTGNLLVADYGPDAGSASSTRGPAATTEWNIVDEPGNYGWPFCHGVKCYNDYNFANGASGDPFDPNALVNDSPNNTGLTNLPPVIWPEYYGERGAQDNPWPIVGGNGYTGAPMGGPAYDYDPDLVSETKFPEYWDGKAFLGDWNAGDAFAITMNESREDITKITPLLPGLISDNASFNQVMDATWGPEGSLYVIDWGTGYGTNNPDSGVYRIDYVEGNPSPIARAAADVTSGAGDELTVNFSSEGTRHPGFLDYTLEWNFGDGNTSTEDNPTHTYTAMGEYTAQLTVTDVNGLTGVSNVTIVVGNAAPTVEIVFPEQGGFFNWGDQIDYEVIIDDPDATGEINCDNVNVLPALGHASHQHPSGALSGCTGVIPTQRDEGHGITENIFWTVDVSFTDDGGAVEVPLSGSTTHILNPKRMEAEFFDATGALTDDYPSNDGQGVQVEDNSDLDQGQNLSFVEPGDWWSYDPINFKGIDGVSARLASPEGGAGSMTMHWGAPDGPELGEIVFTETGDWQAYEDFEVALTGLPTESGSLYFVHREGQVNVNYFEWLGDGVDGNSVPVIDFEVDTVSGIAPLTVNATASAVDPEGTDVTLEWDQGTGNGFVSGTGSEQFVYDTPGSYLLRVRATDATGVAGEEYVQITVSQEVALCFDGRSDDFTGDQLDTERWNASVRLNQEVSVVDGHLVIPASLTDIYQDSNDTPNIVLQDLPAGSWQATTKVTIPARAQYQQAGLVVYGDDDNYTKMVVQARDESAAGRIFQLANEVDGSATEDNTGALGDEYPDTVWVRLTSDGSSINGSYSDDGQNFTDMPETFSIADLQDPRIGLLALASAGSPAAEIDAEFDWFHFTPDDTSAAGEPNDEFDGTALDACRWTVYNEDPDAYRVTGGQLEIDPAAGDMYQDGTGVTNFVMQDVAGDWTVETKVDTSELEHQYQQGGLLAFADEDNYVKVDLVATNAVGGTKNTGIEILSEIDGSVTAGASQLPAPANGIVWLRMSKEGDVITGAVSSDGETWTDFPDQMTNPGAAAGQVGVFALGTNNQTVTPTVRFDYFRVVGDDVVDPIVLDVEVSPAAPNGDNDWYTSDVTVEASVTGGGASTVYREYRVDGGDWSEYTAPVVVSTDGEHTVDVRASGSGAAEVTESVSFKIDATVPTVDIDTDLSADPRTLVVMGEDDESGVATLEYRIDGGPWEEYTTQVELSDNEQTIRARAIDAAGNVSATANAFVPELGDMVFTDVDNSLEHYESIMWLASQGITKGWTTESGTEFRPFNSITRDAMAAFLYRYAGEPDVTLPAQSPFVDITPTNTEFYKEIVWLAQEGISTGWTVNGEQQFRPFEPITRDAIAAFLYRFAGEPEWTDPVESPFSDITSENTEFYTEITWLESTGITEGWVDNGVAEFRPFNKTTRDAFAAFLNRYNQQFGPVDEVDPLELSVSVSPATPDGDADWYTSAVTVDATVTGGGEAGNELEISIDGGEWSAFTAPVEVSEDGEHTAEVRASNPDTATVTESVSFKIDGTDPTASIDTELSSQPRTFTVSGVDEASGVALLEYQLDGGAWTEFTADVELSNDAQTITARAIDAAGNQSAAATADVPEYEEVVCDPVVSRDDEFEGDALDKCLWTVINEDESAYRVTGGNLEIDTSSADIYEGGSGVTNFVVQDLPGDWTVETSVDVSTLDRQYQQAGLIALADDDNYVKVDFLATNEAGNAVDTNLEMRSEIDGEVQQPQPNIDAVPEDGIIWFQLSKTGDVFTSSYSLDGETWVPFGEEFTNAAAAAGQVGVYSLGHPNQGDESRTVAFDYFRVISDEPVCDPVVGLDDEFNGDSLDNCRWTVENEDADAYRVANGFLEIDPAAGDIYQAATGATNFVVQEQSGDWTVETMVDTSELVHQYQQAGLIVRADDDNYVKLDLVAT